MTYSKTMRSPDFTNVEELKAELAKLPKAVGAPVLSPKTPQRLIDIQNRLKAKENLPSDKELAEAFMDLVLVPNRKNVHLAGRPDQSFYVPSDKYRVIGHEEAYSETLVKALEKASVPFSGTIMRSTGGVAGARVSVAVWFQDPQLQFTTGRAGETIRIGMIFDNSLDGSRALSIQTIGENLLCKNGMISQDKSIAAVTRRHVGTEETMLVQAIQVDQFIATSVAWGGRIVAQLRAASTKIIKTEDVIDLLWAIGVPKTQIDQLVPIDQHLVGVQKADALSLRGIYDAVTAFYSNTYSGSHDRARELIRNADAYLTMDVQELLDIGQERRQQDEDATNKGEDIDSDVIVAANARAIGALEKSRNEP